MELNKFIKLLEEELEDIPKGILKATTNYRDVEGFSSMHALIIIAFIDNEFDVLLSGSELRNTSTVEELFTVVHNKRSI